MAQRTRIIPYLTENSDKRMYGGEERAVMMSPSRTPRTSEVLGHARRGGDIMTVP